jgi:hypothetical protein
VSSRPCICLGLCVCLEDSRLIGTYYSHLSLGPKVKNNFFVNRFNKLLLYHFGNPQNLAPNLSLDILSPSIEGSKTDPFPTSYLIEAKDSYTNGLLADSDIIFREISAKSPWITSCEFTLLQSFPQASLAAYCEPKIFRDFVAGSVHNGNLHTAAQVAKVYIISLELKLRQHQVSPRPAVSSRHAN